MSTMKLALMITADARAVVVAAQQSEDALQGVGTQAGKTGAALQGTARSSEGVEAGMRGISQSAEAGAAGLQLLASGATMAATALAAAGVATGAGFVGKMVAVQREFDVLNSSLVTVSGSSAAAEREMEWLKRFAKETPFGLAQAVDGFVKMKALGLDPTQAALTSFGNTASAMGKDLNQMIEAVADASTSQFERLLEFGIKAKQEGDRVSLTFQGVTTNIGNNAAEINQYLINIGNNEFGSAMIERAKTLDGVISGLSDSWDELFRTIGSSGVSQVMTSEIQGVDSYLGALVDRMNAARSSGAGMVGELSTGLGYMIARAPFDVLSASANLLNGTLNALTGGALGLNTSVSLLPESFQSAASQAAGLDARIKNADAALTQLEAQFARQPESPYLRMKLAEAQALVLELQRAKAAAYALDGDTALLRAQRAEYDAQSKAVTDFWAKNQTGAQKMAAELKAARESMGALFSPDVEATIRQKFAPTAGQKGPANMDPKNIAKAQLALDLSGIKTKSAELVSIYDDAQKVMQAMRSAGLIDESDYYASKLAFLNLNSEAQAAALEQEIERLEREKLIGKDRIDNERKVAEARAQLAKVKTNQAIGGIVLGIQEGSAQTSRTTEVDKFFAGAEKAADQRNANAVEGIRQSLMSQAQIEAEAHAARLTELTIYNASRLDGEALANGLIEEEKRRHANVMASIASQSDQMALSAASQATDQMYSLLKQAGMEQTALGKVAFLASKALAVAQIILSTNVAAAAALALPPVGLGPVAGLPLAGFIKAMGYASAGVTAGLAIAEASAEGGYDIPAGVNPVVQTHAKEMILPRAQADVIRDLAKTGGGGGEKSVITIVNNTSAKIGKVTEQRMSNGERALIIEEAVALMDARLGDPNSKTSRAMQRNFSVQRSR